MRWSQKTGKPRLVNDYLKDIPDSPFIETVKKVGARSMASAAVGPAGDVIAVIYVISKTPNKLNERDMERLATQAKIVENRDSQCLKGRLDRFERSNHHVLNIISRQGYLSTAAAFIWRQAAAPRVLVSVRSRKGKELILWVASPREREIAASSRSREAYIGRESSQHSIITRAQRVLVLSPLAARSH